MEFQIILPFEIICAHSAVFVQDEMIYRIGPGKIGGQLRKARARCSRSFILPGKLLQSPNRSETPLSIQGRGLIKKAGGLLATPPVWRAGGFGRALPPQKQTESWKDARINKAGRQLQLCSEAHPFPDQSLRQRDSSAEHSVLSGTSNSGGET